jgi:hypothetical protein
MRKGLYPIGSLKKVLAVWFFAGMPLSMLLYLLSAWIGAPTRAVLFLLSGIIYVSGGCLGGMVSWEIFGRRELTWIERIGICVLVGGSVLFFILGIIFLLKVFGWPAATRLFR